MGNGDLGAYHPSQGSPTPDYEKVIASVSKPNSVAAEFDSKENLVAALRESSRPTWDLNQPEQFS